MWQQNLNGTDMKLDEIFTYSTSGSKHTFHCWNITLMCVMGGGSYLHPAGSVMRGVSIIPSYYI